MIRTETLDNLIRHYSDTGMKIRQVETGIVYEDAIDVLPCRYTYEETDEPVEGSGAEEILNVLLGGET